MVKKLGGVVARWAFLVGVILAILSGILSTYEIISLADTAVMSVLVIIGLIVGLFNVAEKEVSAFLLSGLALIIASVFGMPLMMGITVINSILGSLLAIFVPATIVVAIKNVWGMAKN